MLFNWFKHIDAAYAKYEAPALLSLIASLLLARGNWIVATAVALLAALRAGQTWRDAP